MYIILMMSAKMARSGFLKITVFWNNAYDVIISVKTSSTKFYHVIQILLYMCSCDQSLAILAFLWKKLSQPQFYKELNRKIAFFEGWSCFKFNNLRLPLGTNLKFYISVAKGLKLKVRRFWGLIPTFVEVTREKLVGGSFCRPPSWIELTLTSDMAVLYGAFSILVLSTKTR